MFALGILLPGAPDDFLCMLAGASGMKLKKFMIILILCKPGALFLYSVSLSGAMGLIAG
ncbi:SNARE associated Golgi protein [compost metagenome]